MPPSSQYQAPPARFVVLDINRGAIVTFLDRLSMSKAVTLTLNAPAQATCDVPSDNPEVNGFHSPGPFVTMSDKTLLWMRRENTLTGTPWVPRFSGIIQQVNDEITSSTDAPVTHLTALDPWGVWNLMPVLNADGSIPGSSGITYNGVYAGEIVTDLLNNAAAGIQGILTSLAATCPTSAQNMFCLWEGQQGMYAGLYDTIVLPSPWGTGGTWENAAFVPQINFKAGTMLGDALTQMTQAGYCDIMLIPFYDPVNAPGICCAVNVYNFAGQQQPGALFGWDRPGKSLLGMNRLLDGSKQANVGIGYAGQGGPNVQPVAVKSSVQQYGPYWLQTSYTGDLVDTSAVETLMIGQIVLLQNGQQTLTIDVAPERAPRPFLDYCLADSVPVMFSNLFRAALSPQMYGANVQAANPATVPLTVFSGVNDTFVFGGVSYEIAPDTYSTIADVAQAMQDAFASPPFSDVATVAIDPTGTFLIVTTLNWGSDGFAFTSGDGLAGLGFTVDQGVGGEAWTNFQRIYEMPFTWPDDGVETITQLSLTPPAINDTTTV